MIGLCGITRYNAIGLCGIISNNTYVDYLILHNIIPEDYVVLYCIILFKVMTRNHVSLLDVFPHNDKFLHQVMQNGIT